MRNTTYRRWAIFYAAVAALLAGWLLLEKMPDGREELAGSVENAFRRSGEVIGKSNEDLLPDIQDEAEDYPSPQAKDYAKRAEKALLLAAAFENVSREDGAAERLSVLKDSLMSLADRDESCQKWAGEVVGARLTNEFLVNYKSLKTSLLSVRSQELTALILNYCGTKVFGISDIFDHKQPCFLHPTLTPVTGEAFQAEIVLTPFLTQTERRCGHLSAFLNDQPIPIKEGSANLRTTFPTPGPHTLRLRFRRERCRDGSVTEVSRDFTVNVLEQCDTVNEK